jgi:hypothetical protein
VDSRRGSADRPRRRRLISRTAEKTARWRLPAAAIPAACSRRAHRGHKSRSVFRPRSRSCPSTAFLRAAQSYLQQLQNSATSMRAPSTRGTCDARALAYLMMIVARRRPVLLRASQQFLKRFFVGPCNATS